MMNYLQKRKPIKVLVMSVGAYATNWTIKYLERIGGVGNAVVCLPKQYEKNADGYRKKGIEVFVYDEKKYINKDFEFFGFNPRNCGGVGRQGIAEAVEKYGDDFLCFQMDDDYTCFSVRPLIDKKNKTITKWENLEKMIYAFDEFYSTLGIELAARTGATPPSGDFVSSHKIFNNFVMHKGVALNFSGFAALCSDDQRFNIYRNIYDCTPMISTEVFSVLFHQSQGDRNDGNAVLYNGDCSWKKSFALRMMIPWACRQRVAAHENRVLYLENIKQSLLFPPIMLEKDGKIVARV